MKKLAWVSAVFLSAAIMAVSAWAQQPPPPQCPDVCVLNMMTGSGTCSNDSTLSCKSDAPCVAAAIEAACPCSTASNHGQHQSCVVHLRNQLRGQGCSTATIASCSARSTCGKPGRVLCCRVTSTGTCNGATMTAPGTCSNSPTTAPVTCTSNADCTVLSGPHISRDAAACTDRGGYSSGTGSVCAGCQPPVACCIPTTSGNPETCAILTASDCSAQMGTSPAGSVPDCSSVSCGNTP